MQLALFMDAMLDVGTWLTCSWNQGVIGMAAASTCAMLKQ